MPESSSRKSGKAHVAATRASRREELSEEQRLEAGGDTLPQWYKVIMFGLMILGLLWICTYYITTGVYPIAAAGGWNIIIGFGLAMVGFLMTTRWR